MSTTSSYPLREPQFLGQRCRRHSHRPDEYVPNIPYSFKIQISIDHITVLSIPFIVLWNTRISLRKKLVLLGMFSMTVVIMISAIIRVAVGMKYDRQINIDWLCFWSFVEVDIGMLHRSSIFPMFFRSLTLLVQQSLFHAFLPYDSFSSLLKVRARLERHLTQTHMSPCSRNRTIRIRKTSLTLSGISNHRLLMRYPCHP